MDEVVVETRELAVGEFRVSVDWPVGVPLDVGLNVHCQTAEQFEDAVRAAGGLAAFQPINPHYSWLTAKAAKVAGEPEEPELKLMIWAPEALKAQDRPVLSGMEKLRQRQAAESAAAGQA